MAKCAVVPWSRILDRTEVLLAINTDIEAARTVSVIVDHDLHEPDTIMRCLYSTESSEIGRAIAITENRIASVSSI